MWFWHFALFLYQLLSQIAKIFGPTPTRYHSDVEVSDRCLIDGDPMVFAICGPFNPSMDK